MRNKLSNTHKLLISSLICVIILVGGYFVLKSLIGAKVSNQIKENRNLQNDYNNLQAFVANKLQYQADIEEYESKAKDIIDKYPSNTDIKIDVYNFEKWWADRDINLFTSTVNVDPAQSEVFSMNIGDNSYVCRTTDVSIAYNIPYAQLKTFISRLGELDSGLGIKAITISMDSQTGDMVGSINFVKTIIEGSDKEISDPDIDIESGVESIFPLTPPSEGLDLSPISSSTTDMFSSDNNIDQQTEPESNDGQSEDTNLDQNQDENATDETPAENGDSEFGPINPNG